MNKKIKPASSIDKHPSTLDDVLNLQVTDLLSRRLQTIVHKKLNFKTPYQARQAVVHGHIMIDERVVSVPSYVVKIEEEEKIHFTSDSSYKELLAKKEEPKIEALEESSEKQEEPKIETTVK